MFDKKLFLDWKLCVVKVGDNDDDDDFNDNAIDGDVDDVTKLWNDHVWENTFFDILCKLSRAEQKRSNFCQAVSDCDGLSIEK